MTAEAGESRVLERHTAASRRVRRLAGRIAGWLIVVAGVSLAAMHFYRSLHGLTAQFYADPDFRYFFGRRHIAAVDYFWADRSPLDGFSGKTFSVRFAGSVRAPESGRYEFAADVIGGVRLSVDDKPIVDQLGRGGQWRAQAAVDLDEGLHPLVLEYRNPGGSAGLRLYWRKPTATAFSIIPSAALLPAARDKSEP